MLSNFQHREFPPWQSEGTQDDSGELQHELERLLSSRNSQYDGIWALKLDNHLRHEQWSYVEGYFSRDEWDTKVYYMRKAKGLHARVTLAGESFAHHVFDPYLDKPINVIVSRFK